MSRHFVMAALAFMGGCKETPPAPAPSPPPAASSVVASAKPSASVDPPSIARPAHSGPAKPHPSAVASVAVAGEPTEPSSVAKASPSSVGLPPVDFGPAGPLVLKGYPADLDLGMVDYATYVGYSKDGSEVLAFGRMSPQDAKGAELGDTGFFQNVGGKTERIGLTENGDGTFHVGKAFADKLDLLKKGNPVRLVQEGQRLHPPPLVATWPFAKDLTLDVAVSAGAESEVIKIGGRVGVGDPVHPITIRVASSLKDVPWSAKINAILASPDGSELAVLGHFYCMEWCNELVISRLSFKKIAGYVFNDSGFRLHQKKDYAGSRDLFLKATWANPVAPLPPYNLACAYALLKDETNAKKALELAVALGGDEVKARAKKDADFKGVLTAQWFTDLTK